MVFLAIDLVTESDALSGEESGGDAGALIGRDLGALPGGFCAMPLVIEEAGLAVWGRHEPERATGDGEHGVEGVIERVGDEGGFIEDEEGDAGKAADIGGDARETNDAAAVGQKERVGIAAIATRVDVELTEQSTGLVNPLTGLAGGGCGDDDERFGVMPGVMERFDGGNGGLAPLAGATEHEANSRGAQDFSLDGVGLPVEAGLGPEGGVGDGGGPLAGPGEARASARGSVVGAWGVPVAHWTPLPGRFVV